MRFGVGLSNTLYLMTFCPLVALSLNKTCHLPRLLRIVASDMPDDREHDDADDEPSLDARSRGFDWP